MSIAEFTTAPGICDVGRHEITDIAVYSARGGYQGIEVEWHGMRYLRKRLCKQHYLEEWRRKYPGEPDPDLTPQPSIV